MKRHGVIPLAGCLLLSAFFGLETLSASGPLSAVEVEELRLQSIDRTLDRLERQCRRLQDEVSAAEPARGEAAPVLQELRGLRARLERWLARRDRDPHRRNLGRFLRDLESRLQRLDAGLTVLELEMGAEVMVRVGGHGGDAGTVALDVGRPAAIAGVVRDSATGRGIEGAFVHVYDDKGDSAGFGTTSVVGTYLISGLPAGTHYVKGRHPDYFSQLFDGIPCPGYCDPLTGTPIELESGNTFRANLELSRGAVVEGRVTDESGAAIPDVRVAIYDDDGLWQGSDRTGQTGEYSISPLPPGTYFAKADDTAGYLGELFDDIDCAPLCDPVVGTPIVLAAEATARADFALRLGGAIAGRVVDALTGQPLEWAYIRIRDSGGRLVGGVETDSAGHYIADGLREGDHFAVAEAYEYLDRLYDGLDCPRGCDPTAGTAIAVTLGNTTDGIDFALVRASAFSGVVLDAAVGTPVTPAWVDAWNDLGEWVGSDSSDVEGVYTVDSLSAGTYFASTDNLAGYLDELYDDLPCVHGWCDPVTGTPIAVATAMTTTGIDFSLELGGSISGAVSDAGGAVDLGGQVVVWDSSGTEVDSVSIDEGTYLVRGLPDGDHFVATAVWQEYHDELYDNVMCLPSCEDPAGGTPVAVTAGAATGGIDFELCGPPKLQVRFPPHPDPDSFIDGCRVQIDGLATRYYPACPAVDWMHWQWGDGSAEVGFPPRTHTYQPGSEWRVVSVAAYDGLGLYSPVRQSIRLWDCLPPDACGQPDARLLDNLTLEGQQVVQACSTITLGPNLRVVEPGDVAFVAGDTVKLDGVRFNGRVRIDTDPSLLP